MKDRESDNSLCARADLSAANRFLMYDIVVYKKKKVVRDSNAAAHCVDGDIFYAVIHLQLYPWWRIHDVNDKGLWQKERTVIWTMFGQIHVALYINLPPLHVPDRENREIVGAEILIMYWYALNVSRMLTDCAKDASIAMCENAQALAQLNSCLDEKD